AANWVRYRELVRISTAGGTLSSRAYAAMLKLRKRLENPPSQVSVVEGVRQEMWSGWGRHGDTSLVTQVPPERLLERVTEIEAADPINQEGLWRRSAENGTQKRLKPSCSPAPEERGHLGAGVITSILRLWPSRVGLTKTRLLRFCAPFARCPQIRSKKSC